MRLVFGVVCLLMLLAASLPNVVRAESAGGCNQWLTGQSILLAENAGLPLDGEIEMARVIVTRGVCDIDPGFYSSYGAAVRALVQGRCERDWDCTAYFRLEAVDLDMRATPALAMHLVLTEQAEGHLVPRYHFDDRASVAACGSRCAWWWDARSCPNGWIEIGDERIC